jgi:hypothetical protein
VIIITGSGLDDWIYRHFFTISIMTAHNRPLPKTLSIPYWTTSDFSSTVTDLVLIYESVTFSTATAPYIVERVSTENVCCLRLYMEIVY